MLARTPRKILLLMMLAGSAAGEARSGTAPPDEAAAASRCAAPQNDADPTGSACLPEVQVLGRRENLVRASISASQGLIGPTELGSRPRLRSGDLLEYVPGLVATQHSGSGKANQFFLRGFNLDHGTDFATFVDGMPVNLVSHGHGQGYTDLNFLIPEMVEELDYRKGPYFADVGDFASAGAARFSLIDEVSVPSTELTFGEHGYLRGVALAGAGLGAANLVLGAERQAYDGPWTDIEEDVRKSNLVLRAAWPVAGGRAHVGYMGYDNRWNSPDQIPQRAIDQGLIDRFGSLDPTLGGESSRHSLSGAWNGPLGEGEASLSAYAIDYELSLYSNFTYGLDRPDTGDQFRQFDQRRIHGFDAVQAWQNGRGQVRAGFTLRHDDIAGVGLSHTQGRRFVAAVRDDQVDETGIGVFVDGELQLGEQWRAYAGLRYDHYDFEVRAREAENSGKTDDARLSPKLGLAFTVNDSTELYANLGAGFHSNDARGTTLRVDPLSGEAVLPVDPLVPTHGGELGARLYLTDNVHATAALWGLELDSELVFVGDAGNTEASRPSNRLGVELGLYWLGGAGWQAELEMAFTHARFDDDDPTGDRIPGAIPRVFGIGLSRERDDGWFGGLRLRHFGAYPVIEDASVESDGSTLVNLRAGRHWRRWSATLDLFNALDSDDHDIDYYYASRLPGEDAGVDDIHFHAFEPRSLRLSLQYRFD
jgi:outer membrane receptor protein involved in Fe transport